MSVFVHSCHVVVSCGWLTMEQSVGKVMRPGVLKLCSFGADCPLTKTGNSYTVGVYIPLGLPAVSRAVVMVSACDVRCYACGCTCDHGRSL